MTERLRRSHAWLVPTGLILLSLVPALAGGLRLVELGSGAEVTPDNARFFASPAPVIIHIVSVVGYSILGAFQFVPGLRRRPWHRRAGRLLVPLGLAAALSGLWMTGFYDLPAKDGQLLNAIRYLVGVAMTAAIVLGLVEVLRGRYTSHAAWMIRAYALGMGAGTQVFTHAPYELATGQTATGLTRAMLMGAGWAINLVVAEWVISRRSRPRPGVGPGRTAPVPVGASREAS